jgi:DNA processing protein
VELGDVLDPGDPAPAARAAAAAWLALQREWALRPREAALRLARAPRETLARYPAASPQDLEDLALLARLGVRGLPLLSPRYPARLRRLADPAPLLWVHGSLEALSRPGVAIVGPRAATAYGSGVARALARALAAAGLVVISGLARGVDAEAHAGALEAGGSTVAFQACGPDLVYPQAHRGLAARIAERGAVVSELPPATPPRGPHFPLRNRLISGLSLAVVVVEARERSGSLVTARHAADQGVDVLAVPGPIDAATSRGTNRLIRDGARVLLDVRDVLEAIGAQVRMPVGARVRAPAPEADASARGLSPLARQVLACLAREPESRDALSRRLRRPPEALAAALLELELAERIAEDRDGRLRSCADPFAGG